VAHQHPVLVREVGMVEQAREEEGGAGAAVHVVFEHGGEDGRRVPHVDQVDRVAPEDGDEQRGEHADAVPDGCAGESRDAPAGLHRAELADLEADGAVRVHDALRIGGRAGGVRDERGRGRIDARGHVHRVAVGERTPDLDGSAGHLAGALFKTMAGVDVLHVPYKGAGPQLLAIISGEVTLTFATAPAAVPLIKNKQARAIAVTSAERVAALPDVPTLNESALPGYVAVGWNGLVGPAGIPAPVLEKIHTAVAKIYQQPDMREKLIGLAAEPAISTTEEFTTLVKSEIVKWAKAVKDSGAKLD